MEPLLLLHGFTGSCADWKLLRPALSTEYAIQALDIRGHGTQAQFDEEQAYTMAAVAADIIARMVTPSHVVGYSMGGRLALYMACHYPQHVLSLTLVSASPGLEDDEDRQTRQAADQALAKRIEEQGIAWFVDYWGQLALWDQQAPALKMQLQQRRRNNRARGLAQSLRGMGTGVMPPLWDCLARLTCPVHLIVGSHDHKFVALNQRMADHMPHALLTIIEGAGHSVHLEQPTRFTSALLSFLATST